MLSEAHPGTAASQLVSVIVNEPPFGASSAWCGQGVMAVIIEVASLPFPYLVTYIVMPQHPLHALHMRQSTSSLNGNLMRD